VISVACARRPPINAMMVIEIWVLNLQQPFEPSAMKIVEHQRHVLRLFGRRDGFGVSWYATVY